MGDPCQWQVQNRMRPEGQPPSDRIMRVFLSRHRLPRRRRHECYSQHLPARGAACAEARLSTRDRAITNLEPLRCKQLCIALKSKTGEEAATPGQPVCAFARFWKFPSAIRSRESPLLLARRNHLVEPETITFRWNPISSSLLLAATQKRVHIVNKLWTMRLPCGR
jgi:hypothetical protein